MTYLPRTLTIVSFLPFDCSLFALHISKWCATLYFITKFSATTLPAPRDKKVEIRSVPGHRMVAISFRGRLPNAVRRQNLGPPEELHVYLRMKLGVWSRQTVRRGAVLGIWRAIPTKFEEGSSRIDNDRQFARNTPSSTPYSTAVQILPEQRRTSHAFAERERIAKRISIC